MHINVIGAGLAGCEAAMQIASHGIKVHLYEMKPNKKTPAHHTEKYAELVCSNSLKAMRVESAAGLLKKEMRRLDSFLMKCADACKVPAGGALAVDRDIFSSLATEGIKSCELIEVYEEEVCEISKDEITVVASGPLTSEPLAEYIRGLFGSSLSFFDAAAPIVTDERIDMEYAFCDTIMATVTIISTVRLTRRNMKPSTMHSYRQKELLCMIAMSAIRRCMRAVCLLR